MRARGRSAAPSNPCWRRRCSPLGRTCGGWDSFPRAEDLIARADYPRFDLGKLTSYLTPDGATLPVEWAAADRYPVAYHGHRGGTVTLGTVEAGRTVPATVDGEEVVRVT